jgi:arylsulfatase B
MRNAPATSWAVLIIVVLVTLGGVVDSIEADQRPNIILIVADDQGYADVSFRGSEIQTPHLDALAQNGALLNRFYVCPVCSPTRAGLMTGRYPIRFGMQRAVNRPFSEIGLPDQEQTLPELLALAGYQSRHMIGKWHLGNMLHKHLPRQQGFTSHYGPYTSGIDYFKHTRMGQHDFHRDNKTVFEKGYATHLLSAEAVRLIRSHANDDDPFFLYLPHSGVHSPTQAPPEDVARYTKRGMDKPKATYCAMVSAIDDGVGDIVKALTETGQRDDTLIIYISDNGGTSRGSNLPLRGGKGSLYEGGIRVLALANWPEKIPEGTTIDDICSYVDIVPTLCGVAGLQRKPDFPWDGSDVMPVWRGEASPTLKRHFFSFFETYKAPGERLSLIEGDWKLIRKGKPILNEEDPTQNSEISLYNLAADVAETNNLAERHPDRVAKMLSDLISFRKLRPKGGVDPQPGPMPKGWKPPKNWEPIIPKQSAK